MNWKIETSPAGLRRRAQAMAISIWERSRSETGWPVM